jgi:hypothetical protein
METLIPKKIERPILPTYSWRAKGTNTQLFYIRDSREVDAAIVRVGNGPLGFDLEWRPNFIKGQVENPVALVQLSTDDTILLIQISAMPGMLLNTLDFLKAERNFRISEQTPRHSWRFWDNQSRCGHST